MAALLAVLAACTQPSFPRQEGDKASLSASPEGRVRNPYADVEWEKTGYYDANLHTHTNLSDGRYDPHYAIDTYHALDYRILALTDHDSLHVAVWPRALYPWTELNAIYHQIKDQVSVRFEKPFAELVDEEWENRDPDKLGMVSIPGSEISRTHHVSSLFNDYAGGTNSEDIAFQEIADRSGLAVFNHPGRYERDVDWYVDYFKRYYHVVGMEIYNQVDRYPVDRPRWDRILHRLMPGRPVWGFANDDTHSDSHFGRNRNIFLLPALTSGNVFRAMQKGHFYLFVPTEQGTPPAVRLRNVEVSAGSIRLTISGDYDRIEWITHNPATDNSEVIGEEAKLPLDDIPASARFVRAVIIGTAGRTYTQPFGLEAE